MTLIGRVQPLAVAFRPWLRPLRHWLARTLAPDFVQITYSAGAAAGFDMGWQARSEARGGPRLERGLALARIGDGFRARRDEPRPPEPPHPFRRRPA